MKKESYKNKSAIELRKNLTDKREGLHRFRFNQASGKSTNVKEARRLKKDIARIMTALHDHAK